MSENSDEVDRVVDKIAKLVDDALAEWRAAGVSEHVQRARLLTVASHSAGIILGMCASVDTAPRDFIRAATPHLADQIEAQASDAVEALLRLTQ